MCSPSRCHSLASGEHDGVDCPHKPRNLGHDVLREAAPFMGDGELAPVMQVLHALENWQQSLFGGVHAVEDEMQTRKQPPRSPTRRSRGRKRRILHPKRKRCRKWIPLHGVNQEDMAALETDSFLNDLDEVAMLPTLPLPGEAPQMPQCRGRCEKRCRRCRLHDPPVRETRDRTPARAHAVVGVSMQSCLTCTAPSKKGEAHNEALRSFD